MVLGSQGTLLSAYATGLGHGQDGINVWGSVAIPRQRTLEEMDFSKPSKPDQAVGAPCKPLPSGETAAATNLGGYQAPGC